MSKLLALILALGVSASHAQETNSTAYTMKLSAPLPANIFSELAKKVSPAVVSISVSINYKNRMPPGAYQDPFWQFFEQYGQPGGPGGAPGIPQQNPGDLKNFQPVGTGFIIESDGLIVTNFHVIENADSVYVHVANNEEKSFEAKIIGGDKRTDVAILKINAGKKLPVAELGSSDKVEVGEWVSAFGNPYGHEFSMTKGIISAKGRKIRDLNAVPFLQTDAAIHPGNSGGPLVNIKGEVIGVNTAVDARAVGSIGFAIPIDHIKSILPALKKDGKVLRGFIGVQIDNITPRAQAMLQIPTMQGALIMSVMEQGPAEKAGIKAYDVITKFENQAITNAEEFSDAIKDFPIGKTAKVELLRLGKKQTVNLTIANPPDEPRALRAQRPSSKKGDQAPFSVGFKVVDFSENVAQELGIAPRVPRGPIVVEVQAGSPAAQNGLKVGDVILDVNKKTVKSAKEVISALKKGSNLLRVQNKTQVSLIFLDI